MTSETSVPPTTSPLLTPVAMKSASKHYFRLLVAPLVRQRRMALQLWAVTLHSLHLQTLHCRQPRQPHHTDNGTIFSFSMAQQTLVGQCLLIFDISRPHSDTPHSAGLLFSRIQPDAEIWQHTTLTIDRNSRPQRDSNPQFQQAIGRRPMP